MAAPPELTPEFCSVIQSPRRRLQRGPSSPPAATQLVSEFRLVRIFGEARRRVRPLLSPTSLPFRTDLTVSAKCFPPPAASMRGHRAVSLRPKGRSPGASQDHFATAS